MADWKNSGKPKKPDWRGDDAARGRAKQHGWKSGDAPVAGTGRRKLLAIIVGVLALIVAGTFIAIAVWPTPVARPCLVLFANNPADYATRLDVPLDLYGWLGAQQLAEQAKSRAALEPGGLGGSFAPRVIDDGVPRGLPINEDELESWAGSLKSTEFDPLVIYVGSHAGTDANGPFLFARGGAHLPVKSLIATLGKEPLHSKKKILILDPGRLPPQAVYGQLIDDFALRMKELNGAIAECPNLLVIVGCEAGERAWESEEMQASPLALAVAEALNGAPGISVGDDLIKAEELFAYVKKRVVDWTRENRPRVSTPYMMPEGNDGTSRAEAITVAAVPKSPAEPKAKNLTFDETRLMTAWGEHDRIGRQMSPQAYSTRLWRRTRELLLRYDAAVRAGEDGTVRKLRSELDKCEATLNSRGLPAVASRVHSAALRAALGEKPTEALANLEKIFTLLEAGSNPTPADVQQRQALLADLAKAFPPEQRPVEAHLPIMVHDFYTNVVPGATVPKEWFDAIRYRAAQDRTLLSTTASGPYTELLFVARCPNVSSIDTQRQQYEDQLFLNDSQTNALWARSYQEMMKTLLESDALRIALRAYCTGRDVVYADGPWLAEWMLARGEDAKRLSADWQPFQSAVASYDRDLMFFKNNTDEKTIAAFLQGHQMLRGDYDAAVKNAGQIAERQDEWQRVQWLLAVPLIPAAQRVELIAASRRVSAKLAEPGGKQTPGLIGGDQAQDAKAQAVLRGRLMRAMLGSDRLGAQSEVIDADLLKLEAGTLPLAQANEIGAKLAEQMKVASAVVPPAGAIDFAAEQISRVACAGASDEAWEPALVNQRLRWRSLLEIFGDRAARDRWHDENQKPFFKTCAARFYADADAMVAGLPIPRPSEAQVKEREALLAEFKWTTSQTPQKLFWTSEQTRAVTFALSVPKECPVGGIAVVVPDFSKVAPLKASDASARLRQAAILRPAIDTVSVTTPIALDIGNQEKLDAACSASALYYFRGQKVVATLEITVNREAELVLKDPLPNDKSKPDESKLMLAVRAAPDLDLGELVIILDYSESMKWNLQGRELAGGADAYKTGDSRFRKSMSALRKVLAELPVDTRLKIRAFYSDKNNKPVYEMVYGGNERDARVRWSADNAAPLNELMLTLEGIPPRGVTPLVNSIVETLAKNDFDLNDKTRTKTLLVLTDGCDVPAGDPQIINRKVEYASYLKGKRAELQPVLDRSPVALNVIFFALDAEDLANSKGLFDNLGGEATPSRTFPAADEDELVDALRRALRPKVKLLDGVKSPEGFPRAGWRTQERKPTLRINDLEWSQHFPLPQQKSYDLVPVPAGNPAKQELNLRDGDRILLEMAPVKGQTVLRRERCADAYPDDPKATRKDGVWTMVAPGFCVDISSEASFLQGTVFLENVPPHRRVPIGAEFESTLAIERAGLAPGFLWWNVAPAGGEPVAGTITITKLYGFEMPAWKIKAMNWPKAGGPRSFAAAKLDAWIESKVAVKSTGIPVEGTQTIEIDGHTLELRTSFEKHPVSSGAGELKYLVVRTAHAPKRPVFFRLTQPERAHAAEHYYYRKAESCTAVFGPFTEEELKRRPLKLDVIAAGSAATEPLRVGVETQPLSATYRDPPVRMIPSARPDEK